MSLRRIRYEKHSFVCEKIRYQEVIHTGLKEWVTVHMPGYHHVLSTIRTGDVSLVSIGMPRGVHNMPMRILLATRCHFLCSFMKFGYEGRKILA